MMSLMVLGMVAALVAGCGGGGDQGGEAAVEPRL